MTYQPLPLNAIDDRETIRSTRPLHFGQIFRYGPLSFSIRSTRAWQFRHTYSYIGKVLSLADEHQEP